MKKNPSLPFITLLNTLLDKAKEEWMRMQNCAAVFWVELSANIEILAWNLDNLGKS